MAGGANGFFLPVGRLATCYLETLDKQRGRGGRRDPRRGCTWAGVSWEYQRGRDTTESKPLLARRTFGEMNFLFCQRGFRTWSRPLTETLMLTKSFKDSPDSSPAKWTKPRFGWLHLNLGMQNPSPQQSFLHQQIFLGAVAGVQDAHECRDCTLHGLHLSALPCPLPQWPRSEVPARDFSV